MRWYSIFLMVAIMGLAACDTLFPPNCTLELRTSLAVTVLDSRTGENLAPEATVWVRDGAFADTLSAGRGVYRGFERERAGTYTVMAAHPDYLTAQQTDVQIEATECHVITEEVIVPLSPKS